MFLVIAYDISDDKRRLRISRELDRWGNRTQFSVFECDLDERDEAAMTENLRALLVENDALRIYKLCEACLDRCLVIGGKPPAEDQAFYEV
ncbi:MAG: CRISPR-associated endonuclease Cas2 [Acidobacteria bacterium]|nr:CRISPR-associated endonuclease Cas2 [Acidobacteriota bacterium]